MHNENLKSGLVACHECDLLHEICEVPHHGRAHCTRCGAELYRHIPNGLDKMLALQLAALLLFLIANLFPFLSLEFGGRGEQMLLASASFKFFSAGMEGLGVLVFLTSVLFPLMTIGGMVYILLPIRLGYRPPWMSQVYRVVRVVAPWSLLGVFMLGVLVSFVKLLDMATVIPGVALYAFAALLLVTTMARYIHDESVIWPLVGHDVGERVLSGSASEHGLLHCHTCGLLSEGPAEDEHHEHCQRCGSQLHSRKRESVARTWALIATATILFIPANVYPVMTITQLGSSDSSTILGGVVKLIESGMWPLALLVFFASIVVPGLKLIVLTLLLVTVQRGSLWRLQDRTTLYRLTEAVGSWSMVDVFLVAVLAALVDLDALSTISPEVGVNFFAAVVVVTIVAAQSFDPRLIWDSDERSGRKELE